MHPRRTTRNPRSDLCAMFSFSSLKWPPGGQNRKELRGRMVRLCFIASCTPGQPIATTHNICPHCATWVMVPSRKLESRQIQGPPWPLSPIRFFEVMKYLRFLWSVKSQLVLRSLQVLGNTVENHQNGRCVGSTRIRVGWDEIGWGDRDWIRPGTVGGGRAEIGSINKYGGSSLRDHKRGCPPVIYVYLSYICLIVLQGCMA